MQDLYPIRLQNFDQMLRTGQVTTRLHLFVWFWRVGDGVRDQWLGTEGNVSSLKTSSARLSVAAASRWSLSEVRFLPGTWPGGAQCCSFSAPATFLHQTLERGTHGYLHSPGHKLLRVSAERRGSPAWSCRPITRHLTRRNAERRHKGGHTAITAFSNRGI